MKITMNISSIENVKGIESFLKNENICFFSSRKGERYKEISDFLIKIHYIKLKKKEKKLVKEFLKRITNFSDGNINRIITKYYNGIMDGEA